MKRLYQRLKNVKHLGTAILANLMYGFPSRRMAVIGVTGTDGKTTTSSLIYHILNSSGHKTAMITTVGMYIDGKFLPTPKHLTTPSSFSVQKLLHEAVRTGHKYVIIETSSHGIDQNRNWGVRYKVAAITNISHEHLDYHPTFQHYAETKFKFLRSAKAAIINLDDKTIKGLASTLKNKVVTYARELQQVDYNLQKYPFQTRLFGEFNESNCLAAIGVCKELSIPDEQILSGISTFEPPAGRQEIVYDKDFKVMVDFAHTPNAIENVLKEVKKTKPNRLVHLFGAPGHRDISKRPLMGQASAKYADVIVLTADDPRSERIEDIIAKIRTGMSDKFQLDRNLFEIPDRMEAVKFALQMARTGDFLVFTGKGHETTLVLANGEVPWNEKNIVQNILSK